MTAIVALSRVVLDSILEGVSVLTIDACVLVLTLIKFYNISISILMVS